MSDAYASVWAGGDAVATAVIDLYTDENPRVVCWYYRDNQGAVSRHTTAPSSSLDQSLRAFLHDMQVDLAAH